MTHEMTAQLAPAAGSGIGKILFERLMAEADFVDLLVAALRSGLQANFPRRWDKETESWQADPDAKTRVHTVLAIVAHAEGEPVKRIIHQHLHNGKLDTLSALRESPALLAAVEREVEKARWRESGHQAHKRPGHQAPSSAPPIEIE